MKRTFIIFILFALIVNANAQSPNAIKYQTVVRDNLGQVISNQEIELKFNILKDNISGESVYTETQQCITNQFGLVNLNIGEGVIVSGDFSSIDWSTGIYFISVEIDIDLSGNFIFMGASQLLSVPYALYAEKSGLQGLPPYSQSQIDTLSADIGDVVFNITSDCINYYTGITWLSLCGDCSPMPSIAEAGTDQFLIGTNTTNLEAIEPEIGEGIWNIVSGIGGTIIEHENPNSIFTGIEGNGYVLDWTVSNPCGSNSDDINILFNTNPGPYSGYEYLPYCDVCLWPAFDIENVEETGIKFYTLAFIVDNQSEPGANPCWGGFPTYDMTHFQDKIAALRAESGDVIVSFGGANGIELAYAAESPEELKNAIKTVVDAYDFTGIDFDIEGMMVAHPESIERRSQAIKLLQTEYPDLNVSLTLPVMPYGLTPDGIAVVQSAVDHGVDLSIVNIMAMDYGPSGIDMGDAAISAGENLFSQLKNIYQNASIPKPDSCIWAMVGITPMIGENDVPGEIFYLDDAYDVLNFAVENKIGRLSIWSANRDHECENPNDPLYSCSHIPQEPFQFSNIFQMNGFLKQNNPRNIINRNIKSGGK